MNRFAEADIINYKNNNDDDVNGGSIVVVDVSNNRIENDDDEDDNDNIDSIIKLKHFSNNFLKKHQSFFYYDNMAFGSENPSSQAAAALADGSMLPFFTKNVTSVVNSQNSTSFSPTSWVDPIPYEWRILWLIVSLIIFVTGGVANIITAYVILYTSKSLRRASYVLIAGVAVADVWMCLLAHPSEVVASASAFLWHTDLPGWWCPVNETLLEIFSCTSILAQMWVAANRGIAVFAPYFYRTHMRSVRVSAYLLIFGAFIPSVLFNGPGVFGLIFVHIRNMALGDCKHISPIAMVMQLHFAVCYAGPTAIGIAIYLAIFMKIVITTSPLVRTTVALMLKQCRQLFLQRRRHESSHQKHAQQNIDLGIIGNNNTFTRTSQHGSPTSSIAAAAPTAAPFVTTTTTTTNVTTSALRRHAQSATAMFVCMLVFAVAIVPPRILLVNDLYWRMPVLGMILKMALRTTFATNPIFYFCFNRELRAAYLRLFGCVQIHHHHNYQQKGGGHNSSNNNSAMHDIKQSRSNVNGVVIVIHEGSQNHISQEVEVEEQDLVGIFLPLLSARNSSASSTAIATTSEEHDDH